MSLPNQNRRLRQKGEVVLQERQAMQRIQARPGQIWDLLTPGQRQTVFQTFVKVCHSLVNPEDNLVERG
jgi:hypothetical protein